jgi:hypothetical protein
MTHATRRLRTIVAGILAGLALAAPGHAATLTVSGPNLLGATSVVVGSQSYDVTFQDGTCQALFSGCNQASDFAFNTLADAQLAAQALMNQVLLDVAQGPFDTQVQLTAGCTAFGGACLVFVPYATDGVNVSVGAAKNLSIEASDGVTAAGLSVAVDTAPQPDQTWAIFTLTAAVPEPGTLGLIMFGLAMIGARARPRR